MLPSQLRGEVSDCRSVRMMVAESVGALAAFWCAVDAAAVYREGIGTDRTDSGRRLAIVTRIVTHGECAHAPSARASAEGGASARTNRPSRNWWPASSDRAWVGVL